MRKRGEEGRGERRVGRGKSGDRRGERGGRKSCAPQARCSPCNDAVSLNKREKEGREKVTGRREDGTGQRRREERAERREERGERREERGERREVSGRLWDVPFSQQFFGSCQCTRTKAPRCQLYRGITIFPTFSILLGPSSVDDSTIFQFLITVTILVFPRQP